MRRRAVFTSILLLFLAIVATKGVEAGPRLYFDPSSGNYDVGAEFQVKVKIDTDQQEAMASDALINFDSSKLTIVRVSKGDFFSGFDYNIDADNGRLTIYAFSEQALQTKSGTGDLAIITLRTNDSGAATLSFLCQAGNDADSAIWDAQGNDLIDCAANGSANFTIGGGGTGAEPTTAPSPTPASGGDNGGGEAAVPTPVPTETSTPPEAATPTPSQLPETGFEAPLVVLGLTGGIMLLLSLVVVL